MEQIKTDILDDFDEVKRKSIDHLMEQKEIQNIINTYHLTRHDVEDYWIEFLDYHDDYMECVNCKGYDQCPKSIRGMQRVFEINPIHLSSSPCSLGKPNFDNSMILNNIIYRNVEADLFLKDLSALSVEGNNIRTLMAHISLILGDGHAKGVYLYGNPGTGKSTVMGVILRGLAKSGKKCAFVNFPTFLIDIKNHFNDHEANDLEVLRNVDYLVLDDLGGENVTPYSRDEVLSSLIAYRLTNHKYTFFTSVYSYSELEEIYRFSKGKDLRLARLIDRIKACSIPFELQGKDYR